MAGVWSTTGPVPGRFLISEWVHPWDFPIHSPDLPIHSPFCVAIQSVVCDKKNLTPSWGVRLTKRPRPEVGADISGYGRREWTRPLQWVDDVWAGDKSGAGRRGGAGGGKRVFFLTVRPVEGHRAPAPVGAPA